MQYEPRTQVIEPQRKTFDHLVARYGDRPPRATRRVVQAGRTSTTPALGPVKEIYDESFSVLRLTDPYSFTDPRQYYYAPYVTSRAGTSDAFGATLAYLESRDLLERLAGWKDLLAQALVIPLRHYESGASCISTAAARFGFGTTITQCAAYAAFDRIGNAQQISRLGIALDGGTPACSRTRRPRGWTTRPSRACAGSRRRSSRRTGRSRSSPSTSRTSCSTGSSSRTSTTRPSPAAPAYSLAAQHLAEWFKDQRRWLDALYKTWTADPELGAGQRRDPHEHHHRRRRPGVRARPSPRADASSVEAPPPRSSRLADEAHAAPPPQGGLRCPTPRPPGRPRVRPSPPRPSASTSRSRDQPRRRRGHRSRQPGLRRPARPGPDHRPRSPRRQPGHRRGPPRARVGDPRVPDGDRVLLRPHPGLG